MSAHFQSPEFESVHFESAHFRGLVIAPDVHPVGTNVDIERKARILRDDEEIMVVIMAFLQMMDD